MIKTINYKQSLFVISYSRHLLIRLRSGLKQCRITGFIGLSGYTYLVRSPNVRRHQKFRESIFSTNRYRCQRHLLQYKI